MIKKNSAFFHIFNWFRRDFLLLASLNIIAALIIEIFDPYEWVKLLLVVGLLLKTFMLTKISSSLPTIGSENERFSWKYLQSLPLNKAELIRYIVGIYVLNLLPLLIWFTCFQKLIFVDVFDFKDFDFIFSLKVLAFILPIIALGGLISAYNIIQHPRKQYILKNRKIIFYQNLKIFLLMVLTCLYLETINLYIGQEYGYSFSQSLLWLIKIVGPYLSGWMLLPLVFLAVGTFYFWTIKIWLDEKLSYKKMNWNPKRDFSLLALYLMLIIPPAHYIDTSIPKFYSGSKLLHAVYILDFRRIDELLKSGENINQRNRFGVTPLIVAVKEGRFEMLKYLESKGAKREGPLNKKGGKYFDGINILFLAIESGNVEIIKYLLNSGEDKYVNSENGEFRPLHLAAGKCQTAIVDELILKGADVHSQNSHKRTALHAAARALCVSTAITLLEAGTNPSIKDEKGKTALDYIMRKGNQSDFAYMYIKKSRSPASKL